MSHVIIHLAPDSIAFTSYARRSKEDAVAAFRAGQYSFCKSMEFSSAGMDAAEEAFDLTNNPDRQDERERLYGRGRSVSVGDIVEVDGDAYLCESMGWSKL